MLKKKTVKISILKIIITDTLIIKHYLKVNIRQTNYKKKEEEEKKTCIQTRYHEKSHPQISFYKWKTKYKQSKIKLKLI